MFGSNILEIVIGLVFIYLLYSLLATTIKEGIAAVFGLRAKMLQKAIRKMLDDGMDDPEHFWDWLRLRSKRTWTVMQYYFFYLFPISKGKRDSGGPLVNKFYNHPAIKYLAENTLNTKPSYISPECFSRTLVDVLRNSGTDPGSTSQTDSDKISLGINLIDKHDETKKLIQSYFDEAGKDIDKFKSHLEQWFNETMDRASGWYKKQAQIIILFIGLVIAIAFDVDTFRIVKILSKDKDARKELVVLASSYHGSNQGKEKAKIDSVKMKSLFDSTRKLLESDVKDANNLIGLGWQNRSADDNIDVKKILGFFITAIAISLGAPFWFDMLSKLIQIRGAGKKPEETVKKKIT